MEHQKQVFDIQPSMPRRAGRQQNRANPDVQQLHVLPSKLAHLRDNMLPTIYATFAPDLPQTYETFKPEIARWRVRWSMTDIKASRLQATLQQTYKDLYHCSCTIIGVILTMPPTSVTCERSFSVMKRIRNYLRTTMTSDWLLALIHVHKHMNINVGQVINVFASEKCRI